jgi:hypothetical protein
VTTDDFEISVGLRARKLTSRAPPEPETRGEAVRVARAEERTGLPAQMEPGDDYENVVVEKQVIGRLDVEPPAE